MSINIWNINEDFPEKQTSVQTNKDEEYYDPSEDEDNLDEEEWWVNKKQRFDCGVCHGIGCQFCGNTGYVHKF